MIIHVNMLLGYFNLNKTKLCYFWVNSKNIVA